MAPSGCAYSVCSQNVQLTNGESSLAVGAGKVHTGKGKAVPLQARTCPRGSRKLRFPDFMTTAQDGGKVSPTYRPPLPQEMLLVLISVRG